MKVRLFEVFTSVEGEGVFYGTKTLFVRLAGCPFTCFYCDTVEALPPDSGDEYDIESACRLIDDSLASNTFKVNFTGGDPLLQHQAVAELAKHVQAKRIPTYLESSCFDSDKFNHVLPFIDIVKIEFKTKDSEFADAPHYAGLIDNATECLRSSIYSKKKTYIKIVVSARTRLDDFAELAGRALAVGADALEGFVIQPTYGMQEPSLEQLMRFYDVVYPKFPDVRIVPQLHKFIGAP